MWSRFTMRVDGRRVVIDDHAEPPDQEVSAALASRRPWPDTILIEEPNLLMFRNIYNSNIFYIYIKKES